MNEAAMQNHLFKWLEGRGQILITPNVKLFGKRECDLVSVSRRALFISEYEIKISLNDFRREFRTKGYKHAKLSGGNLFKNYIPNYFNFVFPQPVFDSRRESFLDVPVYAGILIVSGAGGVKCVKPAKRLHSLPATDRDISYLGRGLMYRYWEARA